MRADLLASHLLDQAILVRAIAALHAPLGLRRVRRDDPDVQLPAHAPKMRHGHLAMQLLFFGGLAHIHVFPVGVERQRYAILFDPLPQHARRRPDRFLLAQAGFYRRGRVVHHVHQASLPGPVLIPVMEAAVHLHQLPEVRPPLASSAMRFALTPPASTVLRRASSAATSPDVLRAGLRIARCSAASVGPKARRTFPRTFSRIFWRCLAGRARLDLRPAFAMLEPCHPTHLVALPQPLGLPIARLSSAPRHP